MQDKLNQDILLLKLAKVLNKAYSISKEIVGVDHIFMSANGVIIDVKPSLGQNSTLCFLAGEHAWNKEQAICQVNDVITVTFKIEQPATKPVIVKNTEKVIESETTNVPEAA